jgi:3-oxoacyl-[acyl-carrier protein] reductase
MVIDTRLEDRTALITGANHGIGAATAIALAAQGVRVFLNYLRLGPNDPGVQATALDGYASQRQRDAQEIVAEIRRSGGVASLREADLSQVEIIPELFDHAERELGPVEILVNNADHWIGDTFRSATTDHFGRGLSPVSADTHDRSFAVNSRAPALLIGEFARRHIERGAQWGRIIGLTTGPASGFPGEVTYGASKNALESYHVAAAHELGRYGITCNIVCPAPTDTGWMTPEMIRQFAEMPPLYHVGQPDEVADVIVFLASHQARFVTGQRITLS